MNIETKVQLINKLFQHGYDIEIIVKLKQALEEELRLSLLTSKKSMDLYKFAKKFIADKDITKAEFRGQIEQKEKYYLCNGFMLIEFPKKIEGIEVTESSMNLPNFFNNLSKYTNEYIDAELLLKCKRTLKKEPCIITHNNIDYGFNPTFMENVLKVVKNPKILLHDNPCEPIFIVGDNDVRALIMAIRLPKKED